MTKSKLWNIIMMVGGALAVLAPDLAQAAAVLSGIESPWLKWPIRILGMLALAGSRWDRIRAKLQPLLQDKVDVVSTNGPGAAAALVLVGSLLLAGQAQASPEFGGCIRNGAVCFGPSATVTVGQFNFSTSKFSGGIVPGVGYGATYAPTEWYATGLAGYLAFTVGRGEPNQAIPSLMLSFANYLRLGAGVSVTETSGPVETQWRLLFGLGSDFGGSPKYVASQGGVK